MFVGRLAPDEFAGLVKDLTNRPSETAWIEFKKNNYFPQLMGELISGLANSAALHHQPRGYLIWGVDDQQHTITGTRFDPHTTKSKGNEDLIPWLHRNLDPEPEMTLHIGEIDGHQVVVLEIQAASHAPVQFARSTSASAATTRSCGTRPPSPDSCGERWTRLHTSCNRHRPRWMPAKSSTHSPLRATTGCRMPRCQRRPTTSSSTWRTTVWSPRRQQVVSA